MIATLAAAALSAACAGPLCGGHTLQPWFAKLATMATPANRRGRPLHILQIGDSHTAGDTITGAWRDMLQTRYGPGGRGVMPPGRPYDGYLTQRAQATMSPGWRVSATFGKSWSALDHVPLGLSGFSLSTTQEGASLGLTVDPQERFSRVILCGIAGPGAGTVSILAGGYASSMDLGSATERPECRSFSLAEPQTSLSLSVSGGPVTLTSWATFRDEGGVVVSNLGVVGSQLVHFARTDDAVLAEELRSYHPDLIVVAFGTNEGFGPRFSPFEYEITLRTQIGRLRRLAGNVPILLLGAPDALSRRPELRDNAGTGPATTCREIAPQPLVLAPVPSAPPPPASLGDGGLAGIMAQLRSETARPADPASTAPAPTAVVPAPAPSTTRAALFPPAALDAVRQVQRRIAASLGVAFWDWNAAMGGRCTAADWVKRQPSLMRGDYVHYTTAGGREIAARLQADLDRAAADR